MPIRVEPFAKIAHLVLGALGAFHIFFGVMLDWNFRYTAPSRPNAATGETVRWEYTDSDDGGTTWVVYITEADDAKWQAFNVVGVVFLLISGALYLYLREVARREGRTSIY